MSKKYLIERKLINDKYYKKNLLQILTRKNN